jgi:hypothetical protein
MLRHKRLNKVIAIDIYFADEKSIEGYHYAQVFFGMISKMLYVAGMKIASEFADVYLDLLVQCCFPFVLQRDNTRSEMNQRIKDIHTDLIIADRWKRNQIPLQNPAELNGVKFLKSHAQVLFNRAGIPGNLWFLTQDYIEHVYDLSWKIPEQVSRGRSGTPDISHILMFNRFERLLNLDLVSKLPYTTERSG